jgi:hypothetical protein
MAQVVPSPEPETPGNPQRTAETGNVARRVWIKRLTLQLVLHGLPSGIARGHGARQCVTDLNLEISQGYYSYQGSMRSSADAEPPEKRHSREHMLRLSPRIILLGDI